MHRAALHEKRVLFFTQLVGCPEHHRAKQTSERRAFLRDPVAESCVETRSNPRAELIITERRILEGEDAATREAKVDTGAGEIALEGVSRWMGRQRDQHTHSRQNHAAEWRRLAFS